MLVITLKKVCFSDIQNPRLFGNTWAADDKHYLLNRDNLTQPSQMILSQKQKFVLNFSLHFQNLY